MCIYEYIAPTVILKKRGAEKCVRMILRAWYHAPICSNQRQVRDFAMAAVADVTASVFPAAVVGRALLFILWFWLPPCSVDGSSSIFPCSSVSTSNVKNVSTWIFDYLCANRHTPRFYRPNNNFGKRHIIFLVVLK
jgi:hypothetical protein